MILRMRYEPLIDNEEQHIAEMAAYFREQLRVKIPRHAGAVCQRTRHAALSGTCYRSAFTAAGAGRSAALPAGRAHRQRIDNGERSVLVGVTAFAEGLI